MDRSADRPLLDLIPDVAASARWHVHLVGDQTLGVNADKLEVTVSGALIFTLGSFEEVPQVVVAANAYSYIVKVA